MNINNIKEFAHELLNEEVTAIGGHYVLTKEACLDLDGKKVLYQAGYGTFDTTCCGSGGVGYAVVQGFVLKWKEKKNEDGVDVSVVEPIRDQEDKKKIQELIMKDKMVSQVVFMV